MIWTIWWPALIRSILCASWRQAARMALPEWPAGLRSPPVVQAPARDQPPGRSAYALWLPLVWAVLIAAALFWGFADHGYDDPYITYRYAAKLVAAQGSVYNSAERVLSTTTPLDTLVLALAGVFGDDIPRISNLIGCI